MRRAHEAHRMKHRTPKEALALLQANPNALLVDVHMEIESLYGGRPLAR
jgi:hypothetical protein